MSGSLSASGRGRGDRLPGLSEISRLRAKEKRGGLDAEGAPCDFGDIARAVDSCLSGLKESITERATEVTEEHRERRRGSRKGLKFKVFPTLSNFLCASL